MSVEERVGKHWDSVAKKKPERTRWWHSDLLTSHYVSQIHEEAGILGVFDRLARERPIVDAISVGCGRAASEVELLRLGFVENFVLFDYSDEQLEIAKQSAKNACVLHRIKFRTDNAMMTEPTPEYDLVFWRHSLHHQLNVGRAVWWSRELLKPGGVFFMDDYVGPSRFQFSDATLNFVNRIRDMLPSCYLRSPYHATRVMQRCYERLPAAAWEALDPSEAADSANILPAVREYFPDAEIKLLGGAVYHLALEDVIANFDEENEADAAFLKLLTIIDQFAIGRDGVENLFATAVARKE